MAVYAPNGKLIKEKGPENDAKKVTAKESNFYFSVAFFTTFSATEDFLFLRKEKDL
jgi:hypothetical protein